MPCIDFMLLSFVCAILPIYLALCFAYGYLGAIADFKDGGQGQGIGYVLKGGWHGYTNVEVSLIQGSSLISWPVPGGYF
jgi:hypothetical protein